MRGGQGGVRKWGEGRRQREGWVGAGGEKGREGKVGGKEGMRLNAPGCAGLPWDAPVCAGICRASSSTRQFARQMPGVHSTDGLRPTPGSEARGEGRERGNLIEPTSKPPVGQKADGTQKSPDETNNNPASLDVFNFAMDVFSNSLFFSPPSHDHTRHNM